MTPSAGPQVECRADAGSWAQCASPYSTGALVDGAHTIAVRVRWDADSEWVTQPVRWTVDATTPFVTISSAPESLTTATSASIVFAVDDATASVTCVVDGGAASPCGSPLILSGLSNGRHTVAVSAMDAAANSGSASAEWIVEQPDPVAAGLPTSAANVGEEMAVDGSGFEPGERATGLPLARTGAGVGGWAVLGGLLLLIGAVVVASTRRRTPGGSIVG